MWTIQKSNVVKNQSTIDYTVDFLYDNAFYKSVVFKQVSDPSKLKKLIRDQLNQFKKIKDVIVEDEIGWIDIASLEPEISDPIVPTKDELQARKFQDKLAQFLQDKKAAELGFILETDTAFVTLFNWVKDNIKPEYLKFF